MISTPRRIVGFDVEIISNCSTFLWRRWRGWPHSTLQWVQVYTSQHFIHNFDATTLERFNQCLLAMHGLRKYLLRFDLNFRDYCARNRRTVGLPAAQTSPFAQHDGAACGGGYNLCDRSTDGTLLKTVVRSTTTVKGRSAYEQAFRGDTFNRMARTALRQQTHTADILK